MTEVELQQALLAAEHAAVYGYGVLGARLVDPLRERARAAEAEHRMLRDDLEAGLRAAGAQVPGPLAVYDVAVAGVPEALALAVRLEEGTALRWRDLVGGTDGAGLRRLAVLALTGCAVRAAGWRRDLGLVPPTVALPGAG